MAFHHSSHEGAIVKLLRSGETLTLEQVHTRLPQLSWNRLFHAIDALSRRGGIILRRRGFGYELQLNRRPEEGRAAGKLSNAKKPRSGLGIYPMSLSPCD